MNTQTIIAYICNDITGQGSGRAGLRSRETGLPRRKAAGNDGIKKRSNEND